VAASHRCARPWGGLSWRASGPAALIGLFVAVLVPVVVVLVLVIGLGGSRSGRSNSPTHMALMASRKSDSPEPVDLPLTVKTIAHYPLAKAVAGINVSVAAKGMLPRSACKLSNATTVTCLQPTSGRQVHHSIVMPDSPP
jgi:hypothetical protein